MTSPLGQITFRLSEAILNNERVLLSSASVIEARNAPLLYKGGDFAHMDVVAAAG